MNLKFISISLNKKMVLSLLTVFLTFLFVGNAYAQPTATAATDIRSTTFTANWGAVASATSYRLDVSTTPFNDIDIVGWTFPSSGASINPDIATSNNLSKQLITNSSGIIFDTVGSEMVAASNGWRSGSNSKYWQIEVNTLGYSNLLVNAVQFSENRGPSEFKVEYSLDSSTWKLLGNVNVANDLTTGITNFNLPAECNNQPSVKIRWMMRSNAGVGLLSIIFGISTGSYSAIDNIYVRSQSSPNYVQPYQNLNVGNVTSVIITNPNTNPAITPPLQTITIVLGHLLEVLQQEIVM